MDSIINTFKVCFDFFSSSKIGGMSITTWLVIIVIFSAIGLFIRGNK